MSLYLDHFGLAEPPFRITPDTGVFFAGARRGETLHALIYALTQGEGLVTVTGEVGSGKTMLSRMLTERLPPGVETVYIGNPSLAREDILPTLGEELGLALVDGSRSALLRRIQEHLIDRYAQGRQVVVVVDEAHAMPTDSLEEIRLLSNLESSRHKLLQIVLFAQTELDQRLGQRELRPLRDRITYRFRLAPLSREEVAEYLEFRLRQAGYRGPVPFAPEAVRRLAQGSGGLIRRLNVVADKALLAAFAAGRHTVTAEDARRALRESGLTAGWAPRRLLAGGLLGGGLVLAGLAAAFTPGLEQLWRDAAPADRPAPAGAALAAPASPPLAPVAQPTRPTPPTAPQAPRVGRPASAAASHPAPAAAAQADTRTAESAPIAGGFTLQLAFAGGADPALARLAEVARRALGREAVHIVPTAIAGRPVDALCVGHYPSRAEARAALARLPAELRVNQPQVRSFAALAADALKLGDLD